MAIRRVEGTRREVTDRALHLAFRLGAVRPTRPTAKAPVRREAQELGIRQELAVIRPLVVDDHGLQLIEEQFTRYTTKIK